MMDQVDKLKERYEDLEKRKRNEAQGYQSDVKLLNQKIRHVENQLMRASLTKSKGDHEYELGLPKFLLTATFVLQNTITSRPSEHTKESWRKFAGPSEGPRSGCRNPG